MEFWSFLAQNFTAVSQWFWPLKNLNRLCDPKPPKMQNMHMQVQLALRLEFQFKGATLKNTPASSNFRKFVKKADTLPIWSLFSQDPLKKGRNFGPLLVWSLCQLKSKCLTSGILIFMGVLDPQNPEICTLLVHFINPPRTIRHLISPRTTFSKSRSNLSSEGHSGRFPENPTFSGKNLDQ